MLSLVLKGDGEYYHRLYSANFSQCEFILSKSYQIQLSTAFHKKQYGFLFDGEIFVNLEGMVSLVNIRKWLSRVYLHLYSFNSIPRSLSFPPKDS